MSISPALRYHGGKFRLAPWVIGNFPAHDTYVEPYGGAAGVLLHKARSRVEVYNDLDGDIVNYFRVVRDPAMRAALVEACLLTPYAREEFEQAWEPTEDPVERARRIAVRAQMGFGSAGATKGGTGLRIDTRRRGGMAHELWRRFPEGMAAVGHRFADVLIENRPALQVMRQHDGPQTLHYVDPPYMHSVRTMGMYKKAYRYEMFQKDHDAMLCALRELHGMVIVSGYRTELYDDRLADWQRVETRARISAGRGTGVRIECLWLSPNMPARGLFP